MKRVHLLISGRVQGVAFRYYTEQEALRLGLSGFVRNLPDGRVEAVAEGDKDTLKKFVKWCFTGPSMAIVDELKDSFEPATGEFENFIIRY